MPVLIEGHYRPERARLAIVVSRFNQFITERLLEGALDTLQRQGVDLDQVTVVRCPGAFEMPLVARTLARSGRYDAIICLGAVIRGATSHFEYVAGSAAQGLARTMLDTEVPVIFGLLTTDTIEQAIERAGTKAGNKGAEAALTALEMIDLMRKLG